MILLQKQYRPAIDKVCIETPAGLCDGTSAQVKKLRYNDNLKCMTEGETPIECALRELNEETGYTGHILTSGFLSKLNNGRHQQGTYCIGVAEPDDITSTPLMYDEPGISNTCLQMVHVGVDLSAPENRDPKPKLEESEFIEGFRCSLGELWKECWRLEREGYAIDAKVAGLAEGIEMAKAFGISLGKA